MKCFETPLTAQDVIFDMPQEVVGRYQASVEDTVRRSHKRTQRSTHVDHIGNLRMFSHCAGVAPADCPEYSKRPEHNPLVHSLDCCSKFRSLMTVASGVFDRNIAHVFNMRFLIRAATYHDTSSKRESKETRHGEWVTRAPSRDR